MNRKLALADELRAIWAYIRPQDEPADLLGLFSVMLINCILRRKLIRDRNNIPVWEMNLFSARLFNIVEANGFESLIKKLNNLNFQQAYALILAIDTFRSRGYQINIEVPSGIDFIIVFQKSKINVKVIEFSNFPTGKSYLNKIGKKRRRLPKTDGNLICVVLPKISDESLSRAIEARPVLEASARRFLKLTSRVSFMVNISETFEFERHQDEEFIVDNQLFTFEKSPTASHLDEATLLSLLTGDSDAPPTSHAFENYLPWLREIIEKESSKDKWWRELEPAYQDRAKTLGWDHPIDEVAFRFQVNLEWLSRFAERDLDVEFRYLKAGIGRLINASSTTIPKDTVTIYDSVEPVLRNFFRYAMAVSPSFLGFQFPEEPTQAPIFEIDGPTDIATRFRLLPDVTLDAVRERYAHALQVAAWDIITLHEIGHIYSGHNDLKRTRKELGKPLCIDEMRALEIDADAFSMITTLEIWHSNGMKFLGPTEDMVRVPQIEERFGTNATAYFIALVAYCCVVRMDLDSEWSLDSKSDAHPAPPLRRLHNLMAAMQHAEKSFPELEKRDINMKFDYVLSTVTEAEELYRRVNSLSVGFTNLVSDSESEFSQLQDLVKIRNDLVRELEPLQRGRRMVRTQ